MGRTHYNPLYRKLRHRYRSYKSRALKRGLPFKLTNGQFVLLVLSNCYYCGRSPTNSSGIHGIDRRDNRRGYVTTNAVPCCWECNKRKGKQSVQEFAAWIRAVAAMIDNWDK